MTTENEHSQPFLQPESDETTASPPPPRPAAAEDAAYEDRAYDDDAVANPDDDFDLSVKVPRSAYNFDDALDIDAALAAVSALPDLLAEPTHASTVADFTATDTQLQPMVPEMPREATPRFVAGDGGDFQTPTFTRMQRGSPASVIPAILLIAVGAYLTFALTLFPTPPAPGVVSLLVCGVIGLTLISHWLQSGRWARGALFMGIVLIFSGLCLYALTTLSLFAPDDGLPLLLGTLGGALLLSGVLARPRSGRFAAIGLGLLAASGGLWAINQGLLNMATLEGLRSAWGVVLTLLAVLMLLALIFRRQPAA